MMSVQDISLCLVLCLLPAVMVVGAFQWKRRLGRLSDTKFYHFCAAAEDIADPVFAWQLEAGGKYLKEKVLFLILIGILTAIILGGYLMVQASPSASDPKLQKVFAVVWLSLSALYGFAWKSFFDTLRESKLHAAVGGNDIALKDGILFVSAAMAEGHARDILRLHNRPLLRLPLAESSGCRVRRAGTSGRVSIPACLWFGFDDFPEGFYILRRPLAGRERELFDHIEKLLRHPVKFEDALR